MQFMMFFVQRYFPLFLISTGLFIIGMLSTAGFELESSLGILRLNSFCLPILLHEALFVVWVLIDERRRSYSGFFKRKTNLIKFFGIGLGGLGIAFWIWDFYHPSRIWEHFSGNGLTPAEWQSLKNTLWFWSWLIQWIWLFLTKLRSKSGLESFEVALEKIAGGLSFLSLSLAFISLYSFEVGEPYRFLLFAFFLGAIGFGQGWTWPLNQLKKDRTRIYLGVFIGLFCLILIILALCRFSMLRAYEDFPQFMQSLWSSLHDRFMNITFTRFPGEGHSFFAKHFQPFLLLLFPFYVIFKNGGFLIVLNVLAVGFAAVPLYLIVRERLKHTWLALAIAFVYLFSPLIQRGTLYDFHPESFVPLFLFWAFYFMQRDRPLLHWGTCFLLLTVKEDCFIHVTLLGLYGILFEKKRKLGGVTAIMAILWGVLSYAWIIPFFKGGKSHIFSGRYGKFSADNLFDLIYNILANPDKVVELLVSPDIILGILFLSMPLLLLPWLSLRGLFLILPLNLEFFLSSFVPVRLLVVHYSFLVLPNYLIGAILTVEGYLKNPRLTGVKLSSGLVGYFLTCAIFFNFFFAPYRSIGYGPMEHEVLEWSPLGRRFDIHYYTESAHHKIGREFIKKYIPERVSLSTVYNFATHLSNRRILRVFANTQGAELVFIDFFCENPNKFFNFGHLFFRQSVARLLLNSSYGVMKYHDGYTLLKKGFSKGKNMRVLRELMTKHSATDFDSDIGRTRPDPAARNHIARVADAKWDREGILVSSPKWNLPEGNYRAIFKLKTSHNDIDKPIAEILITTMNDGNTEVVSSKTLKGKDFYFESHYQDFLMGFDARGLKEIQMKIRFLGEGDLWFGGLDLKIPQLSSNQINNFLKQKRIRF